ncbi:MULTISPECIES: hypothetical protein [unclassified Pasteurella]|uniref:hypothetical protein n=1 Tax=unclassified Pasteurella TaxID=2621516 RepID=UPI00143198CB|nr:hypothetical protein [Pasteurella sp. 19428wF3_WM03]
MFKSLVQIFKSKPTVSHQAKTDNPLLRQDLDGWIIPYSASELLNTELSQHYLDLLQQ